MRLSLQRALRDFCSAENESPGLPRQHGVWGGGGGRGGVPGLFTKKWVPEQGMWDLRRSEDILWLPNV